MAGKSALAGRYSTFVVVAGFLVFALAALSDLGSAAAREAVGSDSVGRRSNDMALERCNPSQAAEDFWFAGVDPEAVTLWFDTVEEAENYADPEGRSVYWLVRVARSLKSDSFVSGINDLWAVEFYVSRVKCELVVTGEH